MTVATTTLQVNFVSESAANANTFGWYNSVTGLGGILFADVEADGSHAPLTSGVSTATFTVNTADLGNIQYFLISDGADLNSSSELAGPIKVIQLANGTWAVAQATASGSVVLDHGQPNVLAGAGVNAMFTETSKNAGGVDYASSTVGSAQTAATLAGDTADGATGLIAWEDLAATRNANGTYSKPGDADYNDAVFKISIKPTANADAATVSENGPAVAINVLANDTDSAAGAVLHVASVNTAGLHGTVTIAADGNSISYNPGSYFQYLAAGQTATETFTYTTTDQFGGSATASTTVTIVGANDGPTVTAAHGNRRRYRGRQHCRLGNDFVQGHRRHRYPYRQRDRRRQRLHRHLHPDADQQFHRRRQRQRQVELLGRQRRAAISCCRPDPDPDLHRHRQ